MTTKSHRGFTLLEALISFAVVAVFAILAIPSLARSQQIYRLVSAANDVQSRLQYVRIQAITHNTDFRMRAVTSTTYVMEQLSGGSWQVVNTYNTANGYSLSATGNPTFHSRGNATPVATFTVTNPRSETRQVVVETSGQVHAQ